jgi:hypothetical protein
MKIDQAVIFCRAGIKFYALASVSRAILFAKSIGDYKDNAI